MDDKFVFDHPPSSSIGRQAGDKEQIAGLTKIETIDYRWFVHRGERCTALELRRKEELDRKHQAALRDETTGNPVANEGSIVSESPFDED
jgi:hypothetical protein